MMKKPHRKSALIPLLMVSGKKQSRVRPVGIVAMSFERTRFWALGSLGISPRPTLGNWLVMVAPHGDNANLDANL